MLVAGAFLILTGVKILFAPDKQPDPGSNSLIKLVKRFLPVTLQIEGQRFFIRKEGVLYATPPFLALVFIEFSGIIFAILGLRSLYFLLAGVVDKFRFLKYGLGLILIFVGLKMVWLNDAFGGKFLVGWSLGIIGAIIGAAVAASLLIRAKSPGLTSHIAK